ncbi:hypothetical protein GCM10009800_22870 [Nocardiopsis rhodophaea]
MPSSVAVRPDAREWLSWRESQTLTGVHVCGETLLAGVAEPVGGPGEDRERGVTGSGEPIGAVLRRLDNPVSEFSQAAGLIRGEPEHGAHPLMRGFVQRDPRRGCDWGSGYSS